MKVKTTITFEMEDNIFPETFEYQKYIPVNEMKERYSKFILEDIYSRLEDRARNICLEGYTAKCIVEYEDGSKDEWITN